LFTLELTREPRPGKLTATQNVMNTTHIETKFAAMGARLKVREIASRSQMGILKWINPKDYSVDIQRDRNGEFFELRVPTHLRESLDVSVLQVDPEQRHLLLFVRKSADKPQLDRFLCGHDERAWFVAAVPGRVSTINAAKESLKPVEVVALQDRLGINPKHCQTRRNPAFRRQGEWFFVPAPELVVDQKLVLRWEPIRRDNGQAHVVERLYRFGGTRVYVCRRCRHGVTEERYRQLLQQDPTAKQWGWRTMQQGAGVYAQGAIRHPDHQTITLSGWHRVLLSLENKSPGMARVSFLD
jgi:hypothetical protein